MEILPVREGRAPGAGGIQPAMTDEDYFAAPGYSGSYLKALLECLDQGLGASQSFQALARLGALKTEALVIGTATHNEVLLPAEDPRRIPVVRLLEGQRRNSAENQELIRLAEQRHPGCLVLTAKNYDRVRSMVDAVQADARARELLSGGYPEVSYFAYDTASEFLLKGKMDYVREGLIVDLKTAHLAAAAQLDEAVMRAIILGRGYHVSAALYQDLDCQLTGARKGFANVFVGKEPPYPVNVFYYDEALLQAGRERYRYALEALAGFFQEGHWPASAKELVSWSPETCF